MSFTRKIEFCRLWLAQSYQKFTCLVLDNWEKGTFLCSKNDYNYLRVN